MRGKWYASDPVTKPSDYDQFDYGELCAQGVWGTVRLLRFTTGSSMLVGGEDLGPLHGILCSGKKLQNWPIALIPLSARSRKIFNQAEVPTVVDLVEAFLDNGLFSNSAGGIGKTIEQIEKLLENGFNHKGSAESKRMVPSFEKGDELLYGGSSQGYRGIERRGCQGFDTEAD